MDIRFRDIPCETDIHRIREIVESTDFFYDHEVKVAVELVEERLRKGESSGYYFVFAEVNGVTAAYTCFGHDEMTKSSFELFWIVTHNSFRGQGIGRLLLEETYKRIREMGGTLVVAETSGRPYYEPTRAFYASVGYKLEAVIKDYYDKGDDKCFYVKRLD